jgi:predicted esterase
LLHSMLGSAEMYSRLYRRFGPLAAGFKFVFPRAPSRQVLNSGRGQDDVVSWYNPTRLRDDGSIDTTTVDAEQLAAQTKRLHWILEREAALLGGDAGKIVLGGTHMGGSVALHVAMSFPRPLGALLCMRTCLLESVTTPNAAVSKAPVFVFAADADRVHPLHVVREGFARISAVGFNIEWHVEPELTHGADCLNEQRYVAYWIARVCLGQRQGDMLRQQIHVVKKPKPEPVLPPKPSPRRRRAASARPATKKLPHGVRSPELPPYTGFAHSLLREPDWRGCNIKGPGWDNKKAEGFIPPFSPLHSKNDALVTRLERGGPLLGRMIRSPRAEPEASIAMPVSAREPSVSPPRSRPATARPDWNDNTKPTTYADPPSIFAPPGSRPATSMGVRRRPPSGLTQHPLITAGIPRAVVDEFGRELEARPSTSTGMRRRKHEGDAAGGFDAGPFPVPPLVRPVTADHPSPRAKAYH